jgi:phenylpropionate dioxygenase-like ring-hydroxylating dioxygenase large terminal subunit
MNAANPVILERALSRPPKEAEPQLRGDSVGSDRYTCGDYLQREYQKVWHTVWNIGGVAYQMPEPGDYLTTELGIDSIIMVRQEDGSVKAFFNSCPHRIHYRCRPEGQSAACQKA